MSKPPLIARLEALERRAQPIQDDTPKDPLSASLYELATELSTLTQQELEVQANTLGILPQDVTDMARRYGPHSRRIWH